MGVDEKGGLLETTMAQGVLNIRRRLGAEKRDERSNYTLGVRREEIWQRRGLLKSTIKEVERMAGRRHEKECAY
jgi:hypothetical protein